MESLPKIEASEQLRLAHETDVIAQVEALRREIVRKVTRFNPMSFVALAMSRFAEQSAEGAFDNFQTAATELLKALESSGEVLQTDFDAEKQRIGPVLAAASRRHFSILDRVKSIDGRIGANQRHDADKRAASAMSA